MFSQNSGLFFFVAENFKLQTLKYWFVWISSKFDKSWKVRYCFKALRFVLKAGLERKKSRKSKWKGTGKSFFKKVKMWKRNEDEEENEENIAALLNVNNNQLCMLPWQLKTIKIAHFTRNQRQWCW